MRGCELRWKGSPSHSKQPCTRPTFPSSQGQWQCLQTAVLRVPAPDRLPALPLTDPSPTSLRGPGPGPRLPETLHSDDSQATALPAAPPCWSYTTSRPATVYTTLQTHRTVWMQASPSLTNTVAKRETHRHAQRTGNLPLTLQTSQEALLHTPLHQVLGTDQPDFKSQLGHLSAV